ncbi:MAG: hypothetical protein JKY37_01000 [Nannocystaceae bacterium]|nr:hypothetical protein [Nannocystaceae bacterium]
MRVNVLHHAACFDGVSSCALFTAFFERCVSADARLSYFAKQHRRGDPYADGDFDADQAAVLDFRYTMRDGLTWFFDHHQSAFQLPGEREHFDADRSGKKFYDPTAPSCTGYIAKIASEQFGFDVSPHTELLHWAQMVDSADFPDPQMPVELAVPPLRLMTFAEQALRDPDTIAQFVRDLITRPLKDIAEAQYVVDALAPALARHAEDIQLIKSRLSLDAGVLQYMLLDQPPRAYNKFIPYYHHPKARYLVGVSIGPEGKIKLSAGYNPWLPPAEREHDLSALCERFGGGGHPYVGGITFDADREQQAIAAHAWIVDVLRGHRAPS